MIVRIKSNVGSLWKNGAFHIMTGTFLSRFVVFFGSIFVVRYLTKEDFGLLSYAENFYSYAYIFAGFGLSNALIRYVILEDDINDKYSIFSFIVKRGTLINAIIVSFLAVVALFALKYTILKDSFFLVAALLLVLPFQNLVEYDLFLERSMFANKRYAFLSALIAVLLIGGRVLGAKFYGVNGVACSRLLLNGLAAIILLIVVKNQYFSGLKSKRLPSSKEKHIHKYSFQYMITNGLWTMFMLNDVFLLGIYNVGASVIADYKVAYVLPGCLSLISNAIGIFVGPFFVNNENDSKWIRTNYIKTFLGSALIVGLTGLVLFVLAPFFVQAMYGETYMNVVPLMRLLCISAFINSTLRYTTANILAAMGQIKYNMVVSIMGFVLQIVLNMIMIPWLQASGAAIVNIIVYAFMAVVINFIFCRRYKVFNWR